MSLGKNCGDRIASNVFVGDNSEETAKDFQVYDASFLTFLLNVRELINKGFWSIVFHDASTINIFSSPFVVHQSNNIIEDGL